MLGKPQKSYSLPSCTVYTSQFLFRGAVMGKGYRLVDDDLELRL